MATPKLFPAGFATPALREHRLYQASYLLESYGFDPAEVVYGENGNLPLGLDPKWRERAKATLTRHELPVELAPEISVESILQAMGRDKKAAAGSLNMVLLSAPGAPQTRQNPDPEQVLAAIEELYSP